MTPELFQQLMQADAMRKQNAQQMELGIADTLGEEGLREQLAMHTMPQRMGLRGQEMGAENDLLQNQLAQAQAIRRGSGGKNYGTAAGNIAAGLGDALGNFFGGRHEAGALDAMRANNKSGFGDMRGLLGRMDDAGYAGVKAQHDYMRKLPGMGPQAQAPTLPAAATHDPNADLLAPLVPNKQMPSAFGEGVPLVPFELPQKKPMGMLAQGPRSAGFGLGGLKLPFLGG